MCGEKSRVIPSRDSTFRPFTLAFSRPIIRSGAKWLPSGFAVIQDLGFLIGYSSIELLEVNMRNPRLAGLFVLLATSTQAQWLHYPTPGTPRTPDGKPNLAAKAPRAPNGKPDLSGVWQAEYAPPGENERLFGDVFKDFVVPGDDPRTFSKYFLNILADFKPQEAPLRPEAAALFRKHVNRESPSTRCVPQGIP